jgi:tetratricopeptide (TPR) repeat protein
MNYRLKIIDYKWWAFIFNLAFLILNSFCFSQNADTSEWKDVRAKIAHEDFFLKYHPTAIHYILRANLEMQIKQFDAAIKDYTKTIELDAQNADAYNRRGKARACIKDYADAKADFEKAVALNPNEQSYKDNLKLMQIRESIKH